MTMTDGADGIDFVPYNMEHDQVLGILHRLIEKKRRATEELEIFKRAAIPWVQQNGSLKVSDDHWFYVGTTKKTICRNVDTAFERILDLVDGDMSQLVNALSANAIKHGYVRKLITQAHLECEGAGFTESQCRAAADKEFDELFSVIETDMLRDGKPTKKLIEFDGKFVRR